MFISSLKIENFKRIEATAVPLGPITVVVGGNNSGKSCVLQAPHFAVNLLQATVIEGDKTIPAQNLRYLPTGDVLDLSHGERLTEETAPVQICFEISDAADSADRREYSVSFKRGEGLNVRIDSSSDDQTETEMSNTQQPFSIYVPGLAGIPLHEEYRSDAIIASAIARGDANLYLRNVLLRISRDAEKLGRLNSYLDRIVEGAELVVQFEKENDSHILVWIRKDDRDTPIDAMGTGILQFLQILAYVIEYRPALVLLDEPDAHLHPNNQRVIASLLDEVVQDGNTQVVLATHSRTLLDAFRQTELASFVWMENGTVQSQAEQEHISMLMELGALDGGEQFYSDKCTAVFLTEDTKLEYLRPFLLSNSIDPDQTLIHSYKSSSRLQAALELAKFIKSLRPGARVIVHRDRDFMVDEDVEEIRTTLLKDGDDIDLFVTEGCDIEHYYTRPEHLSASFEIDLEGAELLTSEVLEANKVDLTVRYVQKLEELKRLIRGDRGDLRKDPRVAKGTKPLERQHAVGKLLVGKILEHVQGGVSDPKTRILQSRPSLADDNLVAIAAKIPQKEAEKLTGHD